METCIKGKITVGEIEIKLAVYDESNFDSGKRFGVLNKYFLSLELQAAQAIGLNLEIYREWRSKQS